MKKFSIAVMLTLVFLFAFTTSSFAGSKQIATPNCAYECDYLCAPPAAGSYSQAIKKGNTVYLAGQVALDPCYYPDGDGVFVKRIVGASVIDNDNDYVPEEVSETRIVDQTKRVMQNLGAVLYESGMTFKDVLSTTVYLNDISDFTQFDAMYGLYFKCGQHPNNDDLFCAVDKDGKVIQDEFGNDICCDPNDPYCGKNCRHAAPPPARATIGGADIPLNSYGAILEVSMTAAK